ncbi:DUF6431 domain-containing protein [Clostridium boliviensis]|uniref:DUF6431 domain-containing protein n=1 Tax=Clostridium boliviensis TaxID=318465 RepID=UPI0034E00A92
MRKSIFFVESSETSICPICGHPLVLRDHVKRIVKGKGDEIRWLLIRRLSCTNDKCNAIHRELPDLLALFKHFETDIIAGVLDCLIPPDTQGYQVSSLRVPAGHTQRWSRIHANPTPTIDKVPKYLNCHYNLYNVYEDQCYPHCNINNLYLFHLFV